MSLLSYLWQKQCLLDIGGFRLMHIDLGRENTGSLSSLGSAGLQIVVLTSQLINKQEIDVIPEAVCTDTIFLGF